MRQDTDVNTSPLQTHSEETVCLLKMVKDSSMESPESHKCGLSCLGPLTFHPEAVGAKVRLSEGGRRAQRTGNTFKNGVVFSSRPVKINEKVRLRVEEKLSNWHGALRVGFTNVPPSARPLPLPIMAIPDLTDTPGNWAGPVRESFCRAGDELEFWVSHGGSIHVTVNNTRRHKLFTGVDLTLPLWAMMDVYGQTCSIYLMGSEKSSTFCTRRSCPAPERLSPPRVDNRYSYIPDDDCISCLDMENPGAGDSVLHCVVCLGREARITLPCGHRCLCRHCAPRVFQQFDCCPLCREKIGAPSEGGRRVSAALSATE